MSEPGSLRHLAAAALREDLGAAGCVTSTSLGLAETPVRARIVAKAPGILSGMDVVQAVAEEVSPLLRVDARVGDGEAVEPGSLVASISGPRTAILLFERTALNFLQRLSGIATLTREFVKRVEGTRARIYDTRKTTPLLRSLEKNAVLAGGGENHRFGLYDQILVKENHIFAFCQEKGLPTRGPAAVASVVRAARAARPEGVRLEIEVRDGDEAEAAARAGAEIVLLDNFTVEDLAATVKTIRALEGPAATTLLEASGGITLETVAAVARTGVDRISVGALTHSASALDLSLLMGDE